MSGERVVLQVSSSVCALVDFMHPIEGYELLLARKRNSMKWTLPAGGAELVLDAKTGQKRLETSREALRRELLQETGINIKDLSHLSFIGALIMDHPTKNKHSLGFVFAATLDEEFVEELLPQDQEIEELKFFMPSELRVLLEGGDNSLFRPDFNEGLIRWWVRNVWTHDNLDYPVHDDGPIDEVLIRRLIEDKAWF